MSLFDNLPTFEMNDDGEFVEVPKEKMEEWNKRNIEEKSDDNCCSQMNWTFHDDEWCEKTGERISKHHYTCNHCGDVTQVG